MFRYILAVALLVALASPAFAIHPSAQYISTPRDSRMPYDSIRIETPDHFQLSSWLCKPEVDTSQLVMIVAGGDAGNMSYDVSLAKFIVDNFHLPVLLFDYRGFGASQAFAYDSSAIAHPEYLTDLDAAISFAAQHYPNKKLVVYGRSLGGSLAIVEACKRSGIAGVIAESPYESQAQLKNSIELAFPQAAPIHPIASSDLEPLDRISQFRSQHLLLLHGQNERIIASFQMEDLQKRVPITDTKLVEFRDSDHLEGPFKATQQFGEALEAFLARLN